MSISKVYDVVTQKILVGENTFVLDTLKDKQQYYDPAGTAEALGISSATWSLFGVIWQSGLVLANIVDSMSIKDRSILELGCGIALPGMVASSKGADVTVSDYHPLAKPFLLKNVEVNGLKAIKYVTGDWRRPITQIGRFDIVIASDVLYERTHPEQLSSFIDCHTTDSAEVIVVDPKRKNGNKFVTHMKRRGFTVNIERIRANKRLGLSFNGNVYRFQRI